MKKIAFIVEGETEFLFISKLLKEIAGHKSIIMNISAEKLSGGKKRPRTIEISLESTINPEAKYEALIWVSGTDNRVDTDILDFHQNLSENSSETGYSMVVGVRDLKGQKPDLSQNTLSDLPKMEKLARVTINSCVLKHVIPTKIIIVVYEIETWFLAEASHFERIDSILTDTFISSNFGFSPSTDDMTLRPDPAIDLHNIYKLGVPPKIYKKGSSVTIDQLDYNNISCNLRGRIAKLGDLLTIIDDFLS